jgi:hypothetical protein
MRQIYRQGDVLITRIEKIPIRRQALPENDDTRRLVLAHGEATGHAHVIEAKPSEARLRHKDAVQPNRWGQGGEPERTFLEVLSPSGVALVHDEHATIELPPGEYEITRQREYDPEVARREARVRD